jgi:hypothetical protein
MIARPTIWPLPREEGSLRYLALPFNARVAAAGQLAMTLRLFLPIEVLGYSNQQDGSAGE